MQSTDKETVLLIGRGVNFKPYIQGMIDIFSKDYEVLVLEINDKATYEGKYTKVELPSLPVTTTDEFWSSLKRAEKEIGLNLYSSYSNYFYYGRLAQEACIRHYRYWRTKNIIAARYMQAYEFMKIIMQKHNLKFVFHDTIDLVPTQVVEAFSKTYGFGFYHTLIKPGIFDNRVLLSHGMPRKSALYTINLNKELPPNNEEKDILYSVLDNFNTNKPSPAYLKNSSQKIISLKEIKKIPSRLKNMKYGFRRLINRTYLHKKSKHFSTAKAGKYILYFLSHQPEATTTSAASKYVDQWKIIEELAVHGPSDINIVIKPHPFGYGWQGKSYFEKMLRLPNVLLAPVTYPGKELIQNAHTVLTINGSIGLEALIYDVPAYTLGDAWYAHEGLIKNLDDPKDLLAELDDPQKISKEDKLKILTAAYRASVDFFVDFSPEHFDKKRDSGRNLAEHILAHKEIYFRRTTV